MRLPVPWSHRWAGLALAGLVAASGANAAPDRLRLFSLAPYRTLAAPWLDAPGQERLFPAPFQAERAAEFRARYLMPWDRNFLADHLTPGVTGLEARVLADLRSELAAGAGYGPNYHPYESPWLERIQAQLPAAATARFRPGNRAVAVDNALVRLLPSADPYLHDPALPGEGFPFDYLQNSVIWAGSPVYVLAVSRDRAWCKVVTCDCAGWVPAQALARAGSGFVRRWRRAVARGGLLAVVRTAAPARDAGGRFRFQAYVGSVLPRRAAAGAAVLLPGRDLRGQAVALRGSLPHDAAVPQPWAYTPAHARRLWDTLLGRPYGWGDTGFRNDCSAELKHFFVPFGLWLPRHSSDQRDAGRTVDLSDLGPAERIAALARVARPYRTLVWIPGHVMLYLGPVRWPAPDGTAIPGFMTYQNLWGLRSRDDPDFRAVVGASALFPVLERYPEAPGLRTLADRDRFVVALLDATAGGADD